MNFKAYLEFIELYVQKSRLNMCFRHFFSFSGEKNKISMGFIGKFGIFEKFVPGFGTLKLDGFTL